MPYIMPYAAFTKFTPMVPSFYRNIYSTEEGVKKILFELCKMQAYLNEIAEIVNDDSEYTELAGRISQLEARVSEIISALKDMQAGGRYRNPVTGHDSLAYVVAKQMYDILRVHAMTWDALAATGKTWAELASAGKTYAEVDMVSNILFGDGEITVKYTPEKCIDIDTPGYGLEA